MTREPILLKDLRPEQAGLEIGPSFRPLAPKKSGWNIKIMDHASAAELREKYKPHHVDLSAIEEVDYIYRGERLPDLVKNEQFDYILASHVIEHVPDLIGFLQDCGSILRPNGEIRLAIPDKRFCFDHNRPCSPLSRIIDCFEHKCKIQTVGAAAEYFLTVCKKNGLIAWDSKTPGDLENRHTLEEAKSAILQTRNGVYLDIHNWVFEPITFKDIISKLKILNYIDLEIKQISETMGHEFFASLQKS